MQQQHGSSEDRRRSDEMPARILEEKIRREEEEIKQRRAEERQPKVEARRQGEHLRLELLQKEEELRRKDEGQWRKGEEQQKRDEERQRERRYREGVGNLRTAEQIRILEEEEILLKNRPGLERRASESEGVSGERTEGRSGQTLASGDPFEGLSSGTVRIQLDERRSLHGSQERQPQALPETETGAQVEVEYPPRRAPASEEELDPPPQPGNEGQCCGCRCSIM